VHRLAQLIERAIQGALQGMRELQKCGHPIGWLSPTEAAGMRRELEDTRRALQRAIGELRDAHNAWRKMIIDFCQDCETTPIAVLGEMTPEVGRIFLEQAGLERTARVACIYEVVHIGSLRRCAGCGAELEPVRPGKWQCPECE